MLELIEHFMLKCTLSQQARNIKEVTYIEDVTLGKLFASYQYR